MAAKVKTTISFEDEDFGRDEVSSFSREVADLDPHDWSWYLLTITEYMGFDVQDITIKMKGGNIYGTDDL